MNTSGSSLDALDLTDLMLLQHPEMWGNDYSNAYYDIKSYGADIPAEKKTSIVKICIDCKKKLTYKPERYIRCFHCNRDHWIKKENLKIELQQQTWIPECESCNTQEHDGLYQICDNTEKQNVLNVCKACKSKQRNERRALNIRPFMK